MNPDMPAPPSVPMFIEARLMQVQCQGERRRQGHEQRRHGIGTCSGSDLDLAISVGGLLSPAQGAIADVGDGGSPEQSVIGTAAVAGCGFTDEGTQVCHDKPLYGRAASRSWPAALFSMYGGIAGPHGAADGRARLRATTPRSREVA